MPTITDEEMQRLLMTSKAYCLCILRATPKRAEPGADKIAWEHGRRNFSLRAEGLLSIVCPISDGGDVRGISIFNASVDEVKKIMDEDPAVMAGILTYELLACRGFPGDHLPG